jgi:hypothetical protein
MERERELVAEESTVSFHNHERERKKDDCITSRLPSLMSPPAYA